MFKHLFINRLKIILRRKAVIFWTLAFPLILATLFGLTLSNIGESIKLNTFDVAVVDSESLDNNFKGMIEYLDNAEVFNATYVTLEEATELLNNNKISGYIKSDEKIKVVVNSNGLEQTIIKYAVDTYYETVALIQNVSIKDYELLKTNIMDKLNEDNLISNDTKEVDISSVFFYTLIGMACMYGGFFGMDAVNDNEANMSKYGARFSVSPTNKFKTLFVNVLIGIIIQYIENLILFFYLDVVIGADFGNQSLFILLLMFFGTIGGIMMGAFIGAVCKKSESLKVGILISISMLCSFLAGMMVLSIKYTIEVNVPILNRINPVALITDGLYSLYYYNTMDKYFYNLLWLIGFSVVMFLLSFIMIRRKKYDSI